MPAAIARTRQGHPFPITSYAMPLLRGDAGVRQTVNLMEAHALGSEGSRHPGVRAFAIRAIDGTNDRDDWAQGQAIFYAVQNEIRFIGEQDETVQTPWCTLQLGAGDCDDYTTLQVALLRSLGIPARIQTIATDRSRDFRHVFTMVGVRRGPRVMAWRALDPTVPGVAPGWEAPNPTRRQMWGGDELGAVDERTRPMYYTEAPAMGGIFSFFKKVVKEGETIAKGYAEGGPVGAASAAGKDVLKGIVKKRAAIAARHAAAAQAAAAQSDVAMAGMGAYRSGAYRSTNGSRVGSRHNYGSHSGSRSSTYGGNRSTSNSSSGFNSRSSSSRQSAAPGRQPAAPYGASFTGSLNGGGTRNWQLVSDKNGNAVYQSYNGNNPAWNMVSPSGAILSAGKGVYGMNGYFLGNPTPGTPNFLQDLSPTEKVIGGVAGLGLFLALTR